MTLCSQNNNIDIEDPTIVGALIEQKVKEGASYIEASTNWMEENSIPYNMCSKYLPGAIIDKITKEALENDELRPSVRKTFTLNTLDFLF